jgi:hypothetical protein
MRRIVYLSTATALMSDHELMSILRQSRENNLRDQVTGVLLYSGGNFIQLLEGDAEAVGKVYARIEHDPRHHGCMQMVDGPASERLFPQWAMGFRPEDGLPEQQKKEIASLVASAPKSASTSDGRRALRLIESFVQSMR